MPYRPILYLSLFVQLLQIILF